jgi:hypothetical protein
MHAQIFFTHSFPDFQFQGRLSTPVKLETLLRTTITVQTSNNQLIAVSPNGRANIRRSLVGSDGVIHVIDGVI